MADTSTKVCFVIAPIGEDGTEIRRRSDQILQHVITPAVKECGIDEVVRADGIGEPGNITTQVIQRVVDSELVVADLTGRNPNVYYELAVRHAVKKPYIQLIQAGEDMPFDVAGIRTIPIDHRDLDSVEKCKQEIITQYRHVQSHPNDIDSPISVSIDLQSLRQSENPADKMTAEIVTMLQNFQVSLDEKLEQRLAKLENLSLRTSKRITDELTPNLLSLAKEYNALTESIEFAKKGEADNADFTKVAIDSVEFAAYKLGGKFSEFLDILDAPPCDSKTCSERSIQCDKCR